MGHAGHIGHIGHGVARGGVGDHDGGHGGGAVWVDVREDGAIGLTKAAWPAMPM